MQRPLVVCLTTRWHLEDLAQSGAFTPVRSRTNISWAAMATIRAQTVADQFLEIKMMKNEARAARHLREANNAFKAVRTEKPMTDYAKDQQSLHDNHERLKAARLAREAKPKDDQA